MQDVSLGDAQAASPSNKARVDDEIIRMDTAELAHHAALYREQVDAQASMGKKVVGGSAGNKASTSHGGLLVRNVLGDTGDKVFGHEPSTSNKKKKKGAFAGVFVPTCENMWGVLIFLRFYVIVGQAGVGQALVAVFLSFMCAFCTTCSMSATVSSGGLVSKGGPYYMISRALGPCVGASVGVMYWLAITMLAVLETLGAVEGIKMGWPELYFEGMEQAYGSALLVILCLFVYGGINIVTKLGLVFVLVVFFTLFIFYFGLAIAPSPPGVSAELLSNIQSNPYITGLSWETFQTNWPSHYTDGKNFGYVLSVFFPCFTGILSGANRADILRDPPKDLRRGTFGAIIFSLFMYSSFMILWGMVAHYKYLAGEHYPDGFGPSGRRLAGGGEAAYVIEEIVWNPFPKAAVLGIILSSLSQALQCLVVSPKLLNAIAVDKILSFLSPLAPLTKGEPKRALGASYVVAALLVLIGKLDIVAPLLSMCFLVAYAFMNMSCFTLTILRSPAWRPQGIQRKRWRIWYCITSGLGVVVCLSIMFIINTMWAIIAVLLQLMIYLYINWRLESQDWGSAMDGVRFQLALNSLIQLEASQHHHVNWRPQILVLYRVNLIDELKGIKHHEILRFCSHLRKMNGFCVVACVLEASKNDEKAIHKSRIEKGVIQTIMKEENLPGFVEVVVAPTWAEGANYIIQLTGIGGLAPNTVLLDWPEGWRDDAKMAEDFVSILRTSLAEDKAVLAVRGLQDMPISACYGTIDIWWMIHDGGFLILLAWLLVQHKVWRSCHLRVFTITEGVTEEQCKSAARLLTKTLRERRLFDVNVEVILVDDDTIEPYTHDWTMRVEDRRKFLAQLHGEKMALHKEAIPLEIDELFSDALQEEGRLERQTSGDDEHLGAVAVSDFRDSGDVSPHHHYTDNKYMGASSSNARELGRGPMVTESTFFHGTQTWNHERNRSKKATDGPFTSTMDAPNDDGLFKQDQNDRRVPTEKAGLPRSFGPKEAAGPASKLQAEVGPETVKLEVNEARRDRANSATSGDLNATASRERQTSVLSAFASGDMRSPPTSPAGSPAANPMMISEQDGGEIPQAAIHNWNERSFEKLNRIIYERSKRSQLVVMNLPDLWGDTAADMKQFISYCETLTKGLERVCFVHSSGHEVFDLQR